MGGTAPTSVRAIVTYLYQHWLSTQDGLLTAGLNIPPLTLKNTQTLTIKLSPNAKLIYAIWSRLGAPAAPTRGRLSVFAFAVCTAAKEKNKNRKVPVNSPIMATKWFLAASGIHLIRLFGLSLTISALSKTGGLYDGGAGGERGVTKLSFVLCGYDMGMGMLPTMVESKIIMN